MVTCRFRFRLLLVAAVLLPSSILTCEIRQDVEQAKDWWQTAQFYQIYPRSFMDSNGDGIGDLNGITSKLEYLKEIGVTAAWLSPIFKSPMFDFGYDISSFYEIQSDYGTIDDFKNLIAKANTLGLKIILDFVPNHASTEGEWFKKSVRREKDFEDFFVWHDGYENPNGGQRLPPSNWLQQFRGSAWQWNAERGQFYLHQYTVQQADLNYRNPLVVEQMKRILRFWLDLGVAGFRIDAVPMLFEAAPDSNGRYPDEPLSGTIDDTDNPEYLRHIYTQDQPETLDMVYQWRTVMDDYQRIHGGDTRVLLIETYSPTSFTMKIYGNQTTKGAQLPFNFNLITMLKKGFSASDLSTAIAAWWNNMPPGQTANWVIGNHDQRRASSRYGEDLIDTMNMLVMMLPGASVTYQGEELGMLDGYISWKDSVDPAACNSNENIYEQFTRDPCRTPFQWSSGLNAGFSTASKTWLPVATGYETINVEAEKSNPSSHLNVYKTLVQERINRKLLQSGELKFKAINDGIFVLERSFKTGEKMVLVANVKNQPFTVNLGEFDSTFRDNVKVLIKNLKSIKTEGTVFRASNLQLSPYEALVVERA